MTRLAIVGAMHEEIAALRPCLEGLRTERRAGRDFHFGRLDGHDVILVRCGIGKVAAATTAAVLLDAFDARALLFTGVAGGLGTGVRVGDIVVASALLQHDMNAEPLFPRWEVPLTGRARFDADTAWAARLLQASHAVAAANVHADTAVIHQGLVVSGDRFVATLAESDLLRAALPDALAVEMEGAAVAQVCYEHGVRFGIARVISDSANHGAAVDFSRFLTEACGPYARALVEGALAS